MFSLHITRAQLCRLRYWYSSYVHISHHLSITCRYCEWSNINRNNIDIQAILLQLIFHFYEFCSFYSAPNCIASAVLATAIPSVCPSVCPSVTRRYCVKTTARSTMQFSPLDSKTTPSPWNLASKWPALSCQWYPMGDVRTHNWRTDRHRIFKLGGGVDHVTRHVWPVTKVKRSKVKVTRCASRDTLSRSVGQLERK